MSIENLKTVGKLFATRLMFYACPVAAGVGSRDEEFSLFLIPLRGLVNIVAALASLRLGGVVLVMS